MAEKRAAWGWSMVFVLALATSYAVFNLQGQHDNKQAEINQLRLDLNQLRAEFDEFKKRKIGSY